MDPGRGRPKRPHRSQPDTKGSSSPLKKSSKNPTPKAASAESVSRPKLIPPWDSPAVRQSREDIGRRVSQELLELHGVPSTTSSRPRRASDADYRFNSAGQPPDTGYLADQYESFYDAPYSPQYTQPLPAYSNPAFQADPGPWMDGDPSNGPFYDNLAYDPFDPNNLNLPQNWTEYQSAFDENLAQTTAFTSIPNEGDDAGVLNRGSGAISITMPPSFIPPPIDTYNPEDPHYRYKDELIDIAQLERIGGKFEFFLEKLDLRAKRVLHKICPCFYALFSSKEEEYTIFKALLGFPFGTGVGLLFYYCVIDRLKLGTFLRYMLGAMTVVIMSLGYARSIKMRCITWLIFPCFFGKSGRTILLTMAVGAVLTGPVSNTMDNFKESVRTITCMTELMINLTMKRFELTGKPIFNIVKGFVGDKKMDELGKKVRSALSPVKSEVESAKETKESEIRSVKMDAELGTNRHEAFEKLEAENNKKLAKEDGGKQSKPFKVDSAYLKKLDYRCNDIWGLAVDTCKKSFSDAWDRCLSVIPVIGYLLCWPTKLDFFCYLVKLFPAPVKCDSSKFLNQGFGGAYSEGDTAGSELEKGTQVKLDYKVKPKIAMIDKATVKEMHKGLKNEFSKKQRFFHFVISMFQRVLAFIFVRIFITSFQYYNSYMTSVNFDNFYITDYFRKVERRRRKRGRGSLIPLKKMESKVIIEPLRWKLLPVEKKKLSKGSFHLLLNVIGFIVIFIFDWLVFEILSIVAKHSYVVYTQKGVHDISLEIIGTGIVAKMVRSVLKGFNEKHELNQKFDNLKCLPFPTMTPWMTYLKVFGTVGAIWMLLYFEAYGLRLRRVICSFFFQKREKLRILHLYNTTLKKRAGYTRSIRHQVRRMAREHQLTMEFDTMSALRQQCPVWISGWLKLFGAGKAYCVACKDRQDEHFHFCTTPGCTFAYCESCWEDLREHCYACTPETDDESSLSEDGYGSDKGHNQDE